MAGLRSKTSRTSKKPRQPRPPADARRSRGIGRPPAGATNAVGREALIAKACELLTRLPPSQVTRAEVARSLGVDPSLIRYYFRDRATLLLAAVERLTQHFLTMAEEGASIKQDSCAEAAFCARVKAVLRLIYQYPNFHQLLLQEVSILPQPAARRVLHEMSARGTTAYEAIIRQGQSDGSFRNVDARMLFLAIVGMTEFFVTGSRIVALALPGRPYDEQLMESYGDFVCDLLLGGLRTRADA